MKRIIKLNEAPNFPIGYDTAMMEMRWLVCVLGSLEAVSVMSAAAPWAQAGAAAACTPNK